MGRITIQANDRKQLAQTIIEYNDIFAHHQLDIRINNSFKVKLTPKDERPIYTQSLPEPINLKEDLTVERALMIRHNNDSVIFKRCQPNFRTTKTKWQVRYAYLSTYEKSMH